MTFQPPLELEKGAVPKMVTINDIVPSDQFVAPPVGDELLTKIMEYGIIHSLLLCPGKDKDGKYYPIDGKRRVNAVRFLIQEGYKRNGKDWSKVKLQAKVREDLTPEEAERMAFAMNHSRSQNPFTDMAAIRDAADRYGVDINNQEGHKKIAKDLGVSVAVIRKIIRVMNLPQEVYDAFAEGQVTEKGMYKLAQLHVQTQKKLIKQLADGGGLSEKAIDDARHLKLEKIIAEAGQPEIEIIKEQAENPLLAAIEILDAELASGKINPIQVQKAVDKLKRLV